MEHELIDLGVSLQVASSRSLRALDSLVRTSSGMATSAGSRAHWTAALDSSSIARYLALIAILVVALTSALIIATVERNIGRGRAHWKYLDLPVSQGPLCSFLELVELSLTSDVC